MGIETRSTDAKGRISLPRAFANATVIVEQVSDTEVRIRKAVVIPEDEVRFYEETAAPLSDRDRDGSWTSWTIRPRPARRSKRAARKHVKPRG